MITFLLSPPIIYLSVIPSAISYVTFIDSTPDFTQYIKDTIRGKAARMLKQNCLLNGQKAFGNPLSSENSHGGACVQLFETNNLTFTFPSCHQ